MSIAKIINGHFEANADDGHRVPNLRDIWEHLREGKQTLQFSTVQAYYQKWRRAKIAQARQQER